MTTFAPCKKMRLADLHGAVLGSRILGEQVRAEVVRQAESGATVVVDLEGVQAVSPSFADEIFGKLPSEVGDRVEFVNVGDALSAMADIARAGRAEDGNGAS